MKPRLLTILLLLLAGAVVTNSIPGVLPLKIVLGIDPVWFERDTAETRTLWEEHWPDGWPEPNLFRTQHGNLATLHGVHVVANGKATHWLREYLSGWPYRANRSRTDWDGSRLTWSISRGDLRGIMPLGFTLNTLFYAAFLWLLFVVAPQEARRHLRTRRGLCPACGYPVGESAVCSECGKAVGKTTT